MRRSSRSRSAPHLTTLLPDRSFEQDANSDQYHQPLALLKPRMNELKPNEVRSEQSGLLSSALFGVFLFPSDGGPPGQEAEDRGAGGGSAGDGGADP